MTENLTPHQAIIRRFGGLSAAAAALEVPVSTVQGWWERGYIPARRQQQVLRAAKQRGLEVLPQDFFEQCRQMREDAQCS